MLKKDKKSREEIFENTIKTNILPPQNP